MSGPLHKDACKPADNLTAERPAVHLVSIAGSAGALESLRSILAQMPTDCSWAIAVALHAGLFSRLGEALCRTSPLPVSIAGTGDVLRPANVFIAPAGAHLVVNPDARLAVPQGSHHDVFRPSADWLFESAASSFQERHVAVVLGGMLADGATKLRRVRNNGGRVFVIDPAECRYPAMPRAAIATGAVDAVLRTDEIPKAIVQVFGRRDREADYLRWVRPFTDALAS